MFKVVTLNARRRITSTREFRNDHVARILLRRKSRAGTLRYLINPEGEVVARCYTV